jgi:hypothetical protein
LKNLNAMMPDKYANGADEESRWSVRSGGAPFRNTPAEQLAESFAHLAVAVANGGAAIRLSRLSPLQE